MKITGLSDIGTPDVGDVLPIVDVDDTTMAASGTTKQVKLSSVFSSPANGKVINVLNYGAKGDGTTDDYAAIAAAIAAAPVGSELFFPYGNYKTSTGIVIAKQISVRGQGGEGFTKIFSTSAISSGAVLSLAPASYTKECQIRDIYIDATLSPGAEALYIDNLDQPVLNNIKTRGGLNGLHIAGVGGGRYFDIYIVNPVNDGILGDGTGATSGLKPATNKFFNCFIYQTSGAVHDVNAGVELKNGVDWLFWGMHVLRTPGISFKMTYGLYFNYSLPLALNAIWLAGCEFDGISTLVNNDAGCFAVYLKNCQVARISDTWLDTNSSIDGTASQSVGIDGGKNIMIHNSYLNGTNGVCFFNSPTEIFIFDNEIINSGGGNAFVFGVSTPTNTFIRDNRFESGTLADDLTKITSTSAAAGLSKGPVTFLTDDQAAYQCVVLKNPSTGKTKSIRVARGATGSLQFMSDSGSTQVAAITESGAIVPGNGAATIQQGTGSPEGAKTASVGSLWLRTDGGASTTLYVKESGSGNTGWIAK